MSQLKRYIAQLKKKFKQRRFEGLVICGKRTKELERKAKAAGFEVMEFSLSINFKL